MEAAASAPNEEHPSAACILSRAAAVIDTEIAGLQALRQELGPEFVQLVHACLSAIRRGGKVVLCGIGKSGHISKKIAATLASTGSRAVFMHPVEAMHGDLGVLSPLDLLLAVSYSGETDELLAVLPAVKRLEVPIVAITGGSDSRLAAWADLCVPMPVPKEACPFNLAPTTTTTALAALGDALAMVLLDCRRFGLNDYAKLHPAGAIGRSITLTVKDFMRTGPNAPRVLPGTLVREALLAMTAARSGAVAIVDPQERLLGIFTDGDFRRRITSGNGEVLNAQIESVMTPKPICIQQDRLGVEILKLLEERKIDDILVVDEQGRFTGLVDIQDLPKFKMM